VTDVELDARAGRVETPAPSGEFRSGGNWIGDDGAHV
jgi:hypothetical protein